MTTISNGFVSLRFYPACMLRCTLFGCSLVHNEHDAARMTADLGNRAIVERLGRNPACSPRPS